MARWRWLLPLLSLVVLLFPGQRAIAGSPLRISVPSIGVDAPIVWLGVNEDGSLPTPDNPRDVAWYTYSAAPGENGNVVMAGHRDWRTGETGVFWRLGDVQPGQEIVVTDLHGEQFRYVVLSSDSYSDADAPVQQILGPTREPVLTLITCEGTFDSSSGSYDRRRVVKAILALQ